MTLSHMMMAYLAGYLAISKSAHSQDLKVRFALIKDGCFEMMFLYQMRRCLWQRNINNKSIVRGAGLMNLTSYDIHLSPAMVLCRLFEAV